MISKLQLVKSAIDCHSAVRFIQRKLNLDGSRYRQLCSDEDEFDSLLENKTPEREKTDANNKNFHFSDISRDETDEKVHSRMKVEISQQESKVQQNNLEGFQQRELPCEENQDPFSGVLTPTHTKIVQRLQLESKTKGFLESKSSRHANSNSSLEIRKLANTKEVQKEQRNNNPKEFFEIEFSDFKNSSPSLEDRQLANTKEVYKEQLNTKVTGLLESKRPSQKNSNPFLEDRQLANTKLVYKEQLNTTATGLLKSKSPSHKNANPFLEDRQLDNKKPVHKEQLQAKPEDFLDGRRTRHENSNSVLEPRQSGHSMKAQQRILELKSEGFLEIKISGAVKPDFSVEVRKTPRSKAVQQEDLKSSPEVFLRRRSYSEGDIPSLEVRKLADTKAFENKQLDSKTSQFRKPGVTKDVQPKHLEFKAESFHGTNDARHGNQKTSSNVRNPQHMKTKETYFGARDPTSEVKNPQHTKTVQSNNLELKPKSFQSSKKNCQESQKPSSSVRKPLRTDTVRQQDLPLKTEVVRPSKSSTHIKSNHLSARKKLRHPRTVIHKMNQGFRYNQLSCDEDIEVKKEPRQQKTVQKRNTNSLQTTTVHREVCRVPSWQNNEKATEKLTQRRTAVCDNIERQLMNQSGISLRTLRKYLVVGEILKEVNLL